MKTVQFKPPVRPATAEDWVHGATSLDREVPAPNEPMKRFEPIDVSVELHARVKHFDDVKYEFGVRLVRLVWPWPWAWSWSWPSWPWIFWHFTPEPGSLGSAINALGSNPKVIVPSSAVIGSSSSAES